MIRSCRRLSVWKKANLQWNVLRFRSHDWPAISPNGRRERMIKTCDEKIQCMNHPERDDVQFVDCPLFEFNLFIFAFVLARRKRRWMACDGFDGQCVHFVLDISVNAESANNIRILSLHFAAVTYRTHARMSSAFVEKLFGVMGIAMQWVKR